MEGKKHFTRSPPTLRTGGARKNHFQEGKRNWGKKERGDGEERRKRKWQNPSSGQNKSLTGKKTSSKKLKQDRG